MHDLAEEMAKKQYEIHEEIVLLNLSYSKTSIVPKKWEDLGERQRLNYIETMKRVLADPKIWQTLVNRAAGF